MAEGQHGVITLGQLRGLGFAASSVRSRIAAGRLHHVHESVFAVGHPLLTRRGRYMAAALACGTAGLISHRSAADLWGVLPTSRALVDVISPPRTGRGRDRISVHRASNLASADVASVDAIPCTTVSRTLVDLGAIVSKRTLERACERAENLRLFDLQATREVLARSRGRRGVARLRSVLADLGDEPAFTRSELERRFIALCRRHRLPTPAVNVWIELPEDGVEADFLWADPRVVAEADSHAFHASRRAFERDRLRDQMLAAAGYRVVRFTWRQIVDRGPEVAETLRQLLARDDPASANSRARRTFAV